jgi:hypothetical protein
LYNKGSNIITVKKDKVCDVMFLKIVKLIGNFCKH